MPDITFTLTQAQVTRLSLAVQAIQGLDEPATTAQMKQFVLQRLRSAIAFEYMRKKSQQDTDAALAAEGW